MEDNKTTGIDRSSFIRNTATAAADFYSAKPCNRRSPQPACPAIS